MNMNWPGDTAELAADGILLSDETIIFSDEYIETANQIMAEADRALKQLVILMAEPGSRISHTINAYQ